MRMIMCISSHMNSVKNENPLVCRFHKVNMIFAWPAAYKASGYFYAFLLQVLM